MKPQYGKGIVNGIRTARPAIAFLTMIAAVILICRGMAWLGLPAFLASIAILGLNSRAVTHYRM